MRLCPLCSLTLTGLGRSWASGTGSTYFLTSGCVSVCFCRGSPFASAFLRGHSLCSYSLYLSHLGRESFASLNHWRFHLRAGFVWVRSGRVFFHIQIAQKKAVVNLQSYEMHPKRRTQPSNLLDRFSETLNSSYSPRFKPCIGLVSMTLVELLFEHSGLVNFLQL